MIKQILKYLSWNLPFSALIVGVALWFIEPQVVPYSLYIPISPTGSHLYYFGSGRATPAFMTSGDPGVVDEVYCVTHKALENVGRPFGEWSFLTPASGVFTPVFSEPIESTGPGSFLDINPSTPK